MKHKITIKRNLKKKKIENTKCSEIPLSANLKF